jgi:hypothetical protein
VGHFFLGVESDGAGYYDVVSFDDGNDGLWTSQIS